jgi:hypothetical protein
LAAAAAGMKGMMWDFICKLFSLEIPTLRSLPLSLPPAQSGIGGKYLL